MHRKPETNITNEPKRLHSSAHGNTAPHLTPEEEELERKQAELRGLQSELADQELELANLRGELVDFERRYIHEVGHLYAQLDDLEAQIANAEFRRKPSDDSARKNAENARTRARESAQAVDDVGQDTPDGRFEPSERLRKLYREAALRLHPDLTTDPNEKTRRQKVMAEINKAYEECDEERLRQILDEWRVSPDQVDGEDTAAELVRVIRTIALIQKRLAAITNEIEELLQGELANLKKQVEEAAARGQDLLAEIAGRLDAQIDQARARLKEASKAGQRR
jgi:hypothetical protein